MEYVQTALVQIEAAKLDQAARPQGLLAALDEHRAYLQQVRGFMDMRITRSINAEGNILLVVETRWRDDDSLVEYETREPNVSSIINSHRDAVIADSLQVLDMEALRTEAWPGLPSAPSEAYERLALPLLVPLGVLAFALLVIYGLSRVYLNVSKDVAAPLAAGIAVGILATAWYLATHPRVQPWQIGAIVVAAAGLLLGGGIYAAVHESGTETAAVSEPSASASPASPGASPGTTAGGPAIAMIPTIKFDKSELTVAANTDVTLTVDNKDTTVTHNFAVYQSKADADANKPAIAKTQFCAGPCQQTLTLKVSPGDYFFRCEVHPQQMTGTLKAGASPGASPGTTTGGPAIAMVPTIKFDKSELTVAANTDVTFTVDNKDTTVTHNFAVYQSKADADANKPAIAKTQFCAGPCQQTLALKLSPGDYFFRCDVHPQQMTGTLKAQ